MLSPFFVMTPSQQASLAMLRVQRRSLANDEASYITRRLSSWTVDCCGTMKSNEEF
jgi:hypothetical protein